MNELIEAAAADAMIASRRLHPSVRWWRTLEAEAVDERAVEELRSVVAKTSIVREPNWREAAGGDAAAAVGIALRLDPADHGCNFFDVTMTALLVCAAEGSGAGRLVLAYVLMRLPNLTKREERIAASWLDSIDRRERDGYRSGNPACVGQVSAVGREAFP